MKNGAIYVRVSTDEQAREGYSIEAQIKLLKEYALKNNIFVDEKHIFKDEGFSGRKAEKRPAFMEMIKYAKAKKFDIILVHKFDRFSRNREDSVVYKSLLRKEYGINIISVSEPLDPDDKMSVILEAFLEAMAEYYSLNLSEEVKKGQIEKHGKGQLQTRPSYGYNVENNKLIINEKESKIVKFIFEKYSIEHIPMLQIARTLSEMGIKNKNGNKFENRSLCYILNNPTYIGKLRYTPGRRNSYNFDDPNTILVDGEHQPIISLELWNLAQQELTKNKNFKKPRQRLTTTPKFWISGLIRCKECNCTMVTQNRSKLRCNGYNKGKCSNSIQLDTKEIKELIINELKNNLSIDTIKNIVTKDSKKNKSLNERELLNNMLKDIDEKENRIKIAYVNGIDTLEEYQKTKLMLESEKKHLIEQLSKLPSNNNEDRKKEILEQGKKAYELLESDSINELEKYQIAHQLFDKIYFNKEKHELELYYN